MNRYKFFVNLFSSLSTFYFYRKLREINAGSEPAGITVFLEILSKWNYDLPPESALEFDPVFESFSPVEGA